MRNAAHGTHSPPHAITHHAAPASTAQSAVLFACLRCVPVPEGCWPATAREAHVAAPATCRLSGMGQGGRGQSGVLWGLSCRKTLSRASGILAASPNLPGSSGPFCWSCSLISHQSSPHVTPMCPRVTQPEWPWCWAELGLVKSSSSDSALVPRKLQRSSRADGCHREAAAALPGTWSAARSPPSSGHPPPVSRGDLQRPASGSRWPPCWADSRERPR